jgi:radical SAM superfamily enzyme YgiQ (UPF0313 family)
MPARVLLIGPIGGTDKMVHSPPLGIHRLRSFLQARGIECRAVDPTIEDIPDTAAYDIIGYSVLGWSVDLSIAHANRLAKRGDQIVVFGGYEATFNHRHIVERCTLDEVCCALGESEYALLHLARTMSREAHPGLLWAKHGDVVSHTLGPSLNGAQFADVTLNLDYESIPFESYWNKNETKIGPGFDPRETRVIRLFIKNRCGFTCAFCSSANFHTVASGEKPPVLTIDPARIRDLLVRLRKAFPLVRTFFFQDDEIFAPKTFIKGLLEEIVAEPDLEGIEYICQGRIDAIHPSLLPLMKQARFRTVIVGLESFSQNILSELAPGKLVGYRTYRQRVEALLESGIMPFLNIILTTPGAMLEDVVENLDACLYELERGCELGMNLYTNNWAGSEMAARTDYEVAGYNLLPKDLRVRRLLESTEAAYEKFRQWGGARHSKIDIRSSSRSLLFLYLLNVQLCRRDFAARCEALFSRYRVFPTLSASMQTEAIREGTIAVLGDEVDLDERPLPRRMPFPEPQEVSAVVAASTK